MVYDEKRGGRPGFSYTIPLKMKRKSNKKRNPRLRPIQKPVENTVGWAEKLVNDPLELVCFAVLIVFIFAVFKVLN